MSVRVLWRDVPSRFCVIARACESVDVDELTPWAEWCTDGRADNPGDLVTAIRIALRKRRVQDDYRLRNVLHALMRWEKRQAFKANGRRA